MMENEKSQIDKFRETARELDSDESEAAWDDKLRKLVGASSKAEQDKIEKSGKTQWSQPFQSGPPQTAISSTHPLLGLKLRHLLLARSLALRRPVSVCHPCPN